MPHSCLGEAVGFVFGARVGLRPGRLVGLRVVGRGFAVVIMAFLVVVGLVGLLPGRLVVVSVVGRGRAVVIIAFFVVVGLVGLLPGRLVVVWVVGRAVVQDGIGVVHFGGFHGTYGVDAVVVVTGTSSAQDALQ